MRETGARWAQWLRWGAQRMSKAAQIVIGREMNKLYSLALEGHRKEGTVAVLKVTAACVRAVSEAEAMGKAYKQAQENWPADDGWNVIVSVFEIPDYMLEGREHD